MGEFLRDRLPDPVSYFESQGLRLVGRGPWRTAKCDFHDGSDSLRIKVSNGAWVCMACQAKGGDLLAYHRAAHGLDFITAAKQLGAWQEDGKANKTQRPKSVSAADAIQILAVESNLAAVAAGNLSHGVTLDDVDRRRLCVAARRIKHISEIFELVP